MERQLAINVIGLSKKFEKQEILTNINLSCERGSITGIIGRNGSGKTVLFKCLCGLLIPDGGEIYIDNIKQKGKVESFGKIGAIIEKPDFLSHYTALKNLKLLYCIKNQWNQETVEKYLELVGLNPKSKKAVGKYSLGMKQRLAIAQAIMEGQDILILDEPMNGLDNQGVEDIRKLLFQLKKEGKTILLASHSKEDICVLCEQVYEMDKGILTKQEKLAERDNIWDNNKKAEENK